MRYTLAEPETVAQAPTEAHWNAIGWCCKPTRPNVESAKHLMKVLVR